MCSKARVKTRDKGQNLGGQGSISYQIGHPFDGCRDLPWALRRDADDYGSHNVKTPRPAAYRAAIAEFIKSPQTANAEEVAKRLPTLDEGTHLVLSDIDLMEPGLRMWDGHTWFPGLGRRAAQIRALFPDAQLRFLLSLRSPDRLLSDALTRGSKLPDDPDPFALSWCGLVNELRTELPDVPITTWCAEELPFVWERVLRAAAALPPDADVPGKLTPLESVLDPEAMARLDSYLQDRPDFSDEMRARVISLFLDKFAAPEKLEEELVIPGWDDQKHEEMEARYAADVEALAALEGVDHIAA
ncbi:hypothetical protein [Ruegeria sp. HKCCD8929]|uniref:hypothetical protein n=1 Tax=Ruegeria sp. HKCCD8929 TaxID=2683006 RepID=UPI001489F238|nr:hypothetical protein [Ruegeria sp. HKCCD8929]